MTSEIPLKNSLITPSGSRLWYIRTVQELLGYKDVKNIMIYTHVLNRGGLAVCNPVGV